MADQHSKAIAFAELHHSGTFVMPNPWDAGSARVLSGHGFPALATTSAGLAFSLGRADCAGLVTRDEALANARSIVEATDLPVTADLESGYGDSPDAVAETIRQAAEAGVVGASIEDATGEEGREIRDIAEAADRVTAAAEAARAQPFPFTLTARADNFFHGRADLDDTIHRLQAYAEAGADVLYAPALPTLDAVRAVCSSLDKPVNVLASGPVLGGSVAELAALGVRRISLGSALPRVVLSAVLDAAAELTGPGTFGFAKSALGYAASNALLGRS
ncbi:isocitrate lyase/phosphoenolpyruvate mutase family protein [Streptomyces ipomoeae]|jgi:2-methylisocitrate lyase-like PEP mutase family enzyme|uniref:Isocitrate lyase/phosphoenolpyruvate mutase family protein n=2 Tax=Streptomyces ipomoeae TaxID=103232 RepID=A0AAE8W5Q0_9ACTN|nr:isocitrate lyase/phosphoenolpyruvate mutase family protein [Streptomyces ipomoeae]EKX61604.1 putative phosphorylmutase [Streptomyces ipomoeae 91-03]MDX2693325.1 isocitrate lyase/phosphoenolpyruvate mutase family protein [Streptomyces ipomoeae]MDX2820873.1 isocitrate lyase/phosphoenolpyruvate mutase family protein [Streptomyces ipomoeae]MDX2838976.1 isocitrate lyase/phosphoenolpyruvate mutase family protein [Streptomyces ipomoeae]MDX2873369.1 isocitrate lyase/phosphoenolpyruvate mutase famil